MTEQCARGDGNDAVVGIGSPPEWVCMDHYEEAMKDLGELARRLRASVTVEARETHPPGNTAEPALGILKGA